MCAGVLQRTLQAAMAQQGGGAQPAGPKVAATAAPTGGTADNTVVGRAFRRRGSGSLLTSTPALTSTASAKPGGLG